MLQAWQKVYPSTIKPISDMSAELMSHVRYPTDLFKVQRTILGVYHVDDARSFYQSDNRWQTPNDPQEDTQLQPPYYLTMQMPGQEAPTYSMFTSFIPSSTGGNARNVLMGYLAVDSNAGNEAGVKSEDYGKLRMLVIDADTPVSGPGQVQNTFDSEPSVSSFVNILKQGQSEVLNGNLLTLPVGGGLLYVQPVFVQSSGATKLPKLQKVLVVVRRRDRLRGHPERGARRLFGGDSGADAGDTDVEPTPGATPEPSRRPGPPSPRSRPSRRSRPSPPTSTRPRSRRRSRRWSTGRPRSSGRLGRVRRGRRPAHRRHREAHRARRAVDRTPAKGRPSRRWAALRRRRPTR